MSYDVSATFSSEQVKREGIEPLDMYVLNASLSGWEPLYYANYNQDILGFKMNASGDLLATSQTYTGLPIERDNISNTIDGSISDVSISIPNTDRIIEGIIQSYNYLRGREVHILTAYAKHLPSGSTAKHIGETPDRFAVLKEKVNVDSTTSNMEVVTFTCKPKMLIKKMVLPNRIFSRSCVWEDYLGSECDPKSAIGSASYPECDRTLDSCIERKNTKRYGGFPSIPDRGIIIV